MKYRIIILSVIGFLLSSCGQYGALYLPDDKNKTYTGNVKTNTQTDVPPIVPSEGIPTAQSSPA